MHTIPFLLTNPRLQPGERQAPPLFSSTPAAQRAAGVEENGGILLLSGINAGVSHNAYFLKVAHHVFSKSLKIPARKISRKSINFAGTPTIYIDIFFLSIFFGKIRLPPQDCNLYFR
jgi:hypothetical protein